jgi:hypothetical protein
LSTLDAEDNAQQYVIEWESLPESSNRSNSLGAMLKTIQIAAAGQNQAHKSTPTATPSRVPTASPTPTVTSTPSPTPDGSSFYVSPTGNDSNAGTANAPWRTIQRAANSLVPGQQAIVSSGIYPERVNISNSGTAADSIVLQAAPGADVQMLGFNVSGSYWTLAGFDVSTQANGSSGYGVYLTGSASNDLLQGNYIHELCHEGIYMDPSVSYITAIGNRIWRAEMAGINIDGLFDSIQGNEIWDTQQQPRKLGGIYKGCSTPSGSDADGMRFFGQHHDIRSNYLHDISFGTTANPNPHVDCFQTWGSTTRTVDDILIERNWCRWPSASNSTDNEVSMIEGLDGPVGLVTYQNNVFANMRQGVNVGSNVAGLIFWNNTWDHILQEAVIFEDARSPTDQIVNNIFYDVGQGQDAYACIPSGFPTISANDFIMRSGPTGTYCGGAPYFSLDPIFQNSGDSTGVGADYHLQSASPIKDLGATIGNVTNDYDGTPRPTGPGYSIGAFEE